MTARDPVDLSTPTDDTVVLERTSTAMPVLSIRDQALAPLSKVDAGLAALALTYKDAIYEVGTTAGMDEAIAARRVLRETRLKVEPIVKAQKAELKSIATALETEGDRIITAVRALEDPIGTQIKDETDRKEAAKLERERLAKLAGDRAEESIANMRDALVNAVNKPAALVAELLEYVVSLEVSTDLFGDRAGEAAQVKMQVTESLEALLEGAKKADADRAELDALRASQAAADKVAADIKAAADKVAADAAEAKRISEAAAAADLAAQQKLTATAMAEITRIQGKVAIAAACGSLIGIEEIIDEVTFWTPTEEAYGFLHGAAVLAKDAVIGQLRALGLKAIQDKAAADLAAEQEAEQKRIADAAQKELDDKAEADRVAQVEADAAAARTRLADALKLKKAQAHAAQLLAALVAINVALEALTGGDDELVIAPGPERDALTVAWFEARAVIRAATE